MNVKQLGAKEIIINDFSSEHTLTYRGQRAGKDNGQSFTDWLYVDERGYFWHFRHFLDSFTSQVKWSIIPPEVVNMLNGELDREEDTFLVGDDAEIENALDDYIDEEFDNLADEELSNIERVKKISDYTSSPKAIFYKDILESKYKNELNMRAKVFLEEMARNLLNNPRFDVVSPSTKTIMVSRAIRYCEENLSRYRDNGNTASAYFYFLSLITEYVNAQISYAKAVVGKLNDDGRYERMPTIDGEYIFNDFASDDADDLYIDL